MSSDERSARIRQARRQLTTVAGTVCVSLLVAACGGESGDGGAGRGDPIKIGVVFTGGVAGLDTTESLTGAVAAVQYLNNEGDGIDGRLVELVECNDRADPTANLQCGTQMVDAGVVAVVGYSVQWGLNGMTVTSRARIPSFMRGVLPVDFTDPSSFPQGGGAGALFAGLAEYAATELGARNISAITTDSGKTVLDTYVGDVLAANGVSGYDLVTTGAVPPDFAPFASRALTSSPDAVVAAIAGPSCGKLWVALRQAGWTGPILSSDSCYDVENVIKPAGDAAQGVLLAAALADYQDVSHPDVKIFTDAVAASDGQTSANALNSFSAVMNIRMLLEQTDASDMTGPGFLGHMQEVTEYQAFAGPVVRRSDAPEEQPSLWFTNVDIYEYTGDRFTKVTPEPINGLAG